MDCKQFQTTLENLTLHSFRERKYTALNKHLQSCGRCRKYREKWQRFEEDLASLMSPEKAPAGLKENVMAHLKAAETLDAGETAGLDVYLEISPRGIKRLSFRGRTEAQGVKFHTLQIGASSELAARAHDQLSEYFRGERSVFQLPVDLGERNALQQEVLEAAAGIPFGEVRTYKWIAERIGRPHARRAVGQALHKNTVPHVVPCHRVVRSDGATGGYASGREWKTRLLTLEGDTAPYVGCTTTRIICYRGCRYDRNVREGNRVHFAQLSDALESGYRPCKVCRPA